jgi:hypothetical protein
MIFIGAMGCNDTSSPAGAGAQSKHQSALEKLSPEDRALAERQQKCPVTGEPLGSMGTPVKIMVKEKPVFICCNSCQKKVEDNPDEILQKVEEMNARQPK